MMCQASRAEWASHNWTWAPVWANLITKIAALGLALVSMGLVALAWTQTDPRDDGNYAGKRRAMVEEQIAARGITDPRVLEAMRAVPRHLFVPPEYRTLAYEDHPLPIGEGQTISQPYIVALMTESLELKKTDRVLEIGTGSGYQAAVLSRLVGRVFSVEINKDLAGRASETLIALGLNNVQVKSGDGFFGWAEEAPFDGIIVTCAVEKVPPPLLEQLGNGGRLIIPLGRAELFQTLTLMTKKHGKAVVERLIDVRFVPMTGEAQKKKS